MCYKLCVVGIGEILMDVFENGEATLGGAPFNVAFHVHQLLSALSLGEAVVLSAVGRDVWGRSIRAQVAAAGMSTGYLANVERQPTGTALVFESEGEAGFEIRQNVAWDFIEFNHSACELSKRCDAVVFGSLAQRAELSRRSIREFVANVRGNRLYDVNLRSNTTDCAAGYNAEIIAESLNLATLVKMNDAELEEVCQLLGLTSEASDYEERIRLFMERLRAVFSLDAVAITRGSKGALLACNGKLLTLPDSELDQAFVHPVGGGDSFAAGLLFGIMQGWAPEHSLELAKLLSNWVVRHVSATPPLPEEIRLQVVELVNRAGALTQLR
jgi:fructokinase